MTRSPVIRRRDNRSCNSSRGRSCHRYHVAGRLPRSLTGVAPEVEARHYATPPGIRRQNRIAPVLATGHVARKEAHMFATSETAQATPPVPRPVPVPERVIGYTIVDSPLSLGRLLVGATARGVCAVRLGRSDAALEAELAREHPDVELRRDGAPLAPWVNSLLRHLAGEQARLDVPLDVRATAFQESVWRVLRELTDAIGGEGTPALAGPAPVEGPLSAGEVLAGRYEIDRALGAGGMGVVYAARDLELDEIVALKVLRAPAGSEDTAALDRFRHELRIARRISHPHVVRTHDIGEAPGEGGGRRFITMEYVDGWSLAQLLERRGTLPVEATLVIGKQLCRALGVVHAQGVIHRDLKPQNVLITRGGDVKLTDFGIAELDRPDTPESRAAGAPRGTLAYMAPEQLLGEPIDARTDLYATAAVLCECLTGSPPYPATTPESLLARALVGGPPLVAGPLGDLLRSALSAAGADRPATAAAFHDALAEVEWSSTEPLLA